MRRSAHGASHHVVFAGAERAPPQRRDVDRDGLGRILEWDEAARRRTLFRLGAGLTALFVVVAVPLALLLLRRQDGRRSAVVLAAGALVAGALATIPFALWDLPAFTKAIVEIQSHTAMRMDSLGFGPIVATIAGGDVPGWLPFTAAGLAVLLCLVVAPWTPSGFALSTAVALFVFRPRSREQYDRAARIPLQNSED